jgi:hypothetical protein
MKSLSIALLILCFYFTGCATGDFAKSSSTPSVSTAQSPAKDAPLTDRGDAKAEGRVAQSTAPLSQTEQTASVEAAVDRKIIRNADLTIEVDSTTQAQQQVTTIAELSGGFVVTSESKQRDNQDPAKRAIDIKLVVRVPSAQFNSALQQIEKLASNMPQRNVTGQDVTEEFIDLEARIKTQKALELQFLDIMRQAHKVDDALEVHRQIADVRTEIERLEGRKRFLENRSSLSTITVNIQTPMPIVVVSASGFGHTVREAVSEALDLATGIVLFFVRFVIVITPVLVLLVLPLGLVGLYFRRRAARIRLAHELETNPATD